MTHWRWWIVVGVVFLIGGLLALANPLAATITAVNLAGAMLLLGGIIQLYSVFRAMGVELHLGSGLLAFFAIVLGVLLLARPFEGMIALTWLVAAYMLAAGSVKTAMALALRGSRAFWPVLISGLLSVVLSVMIFANFPEAAATLLGVLLAVDLISTGICVMALALTARAIGR